METTADEADPLKVVNDQVGNPTSCDAVAEYIAAHLLDSTVVGTMHLTCEGEASWYDFTVAIFAQRGLSRDVVPCDTIDFPRPAPRPANSCLENRVLRLNGLPPMPHWRETLSDFLREYPNG